MLTEYCLPMHHSYPTDNDISDDINSIVQCTFVYPNRITSVLVHTCILTNAPAACS